MFHFFVLLHFIESAGRVLQSETMRLDHKNVSQETLQIKLQ